MATATTRQPDEVGYRPDVQDLLDDFLSCVDHEVIHAKAIEICKECDQVAPMPSLEYAQELYNGVYRNLCKAHALAALKATLDNVEPDATSDDVRGFFRAVVTGLSRADRGTGRRAASEPCRPVARAKSRPRQHRGTRRVRARSPGSSGDGRESDPPPLVLACRGCGETFTARRPNQAYCSPQCKSRSNVAAFRTAKREDPIEAQVRKLVRRAVQNGLDGDSALEILACDPHVARERLIKAARGGAVRPVAGGNFESDVASWFELAA